MKESKILSILEKIFKIQENMTCKITRTFTMLVAFLMMGFLQIPNSITECDDIRN